MMRSASTNALDTPAREALLCLSRRTDGFQTPARTVFDAAITACKANKPLMFPGEFLVEETPLFVDTVGRALGREKLSVGSRFSNPATRSLASFHFESSVGIIRAFVGFSAEDAAREYGQYEFIFERVKPKTTGTAPFTDFFVLKNAGRKQGPAIPQPELCEACHHQGQGLFSPSPWQEMSPRGAFRETHGNDFNASPRFFEDAVQHFNRLVNGRRYSAWLGTESFALRKLVTRAHLVAAGLLPPSLQTLSTQLEAQLKARFLTFPPSEPSILSERDPRGSTNVPLLPNHDPLVSRLARAYSVQPHTVLEGSPLASRPDVVDDLKRRIGPATPEDFLDSEALAGLLVEHWPPSAEQLLTAADAFSANPRVADAAAAERKVGNTVHEAGTPGAATPPATASEAFDRYCFRCHRVGNGVVPELELQTLGTRMPTRGYTNRTAANLISNGIMPPRGSAPDDASALDALRAALPPPTIHLDMRAEPFNQDFDSLLDELGAK